MHLYIPGKMKTHGYNNMETSRYVHQSLVGSFILASKKVLFYLILFYLFGDCKENCTTISEPHTQPQTFTTRPSFLKKRGKVRGKKYVVEKAHLAEIEDH